MALEENNTTNPELEEILESESAHAIAEEEIEKDKKIGGSFGSLFGLLLLAPLGSAYAYVNDPARYSIEKLRQKAEEDAKKQTEDARKITKKANLDFSEEESAALHEKARREYYSKYVSVPRQLEHARKLAEKDPTDNYLQEAIEKNGVRDQASLLIEAAQKSLGKAKGKVKSEITDEVSKRMSDLKGILDSGSKEDLETKIKDLTESLQKVEQGIGQKKLASEILAALAISYADNAVREAEKNRSLTEEERNAIREGALAEYYDNYVRNNPEEARKFARRSSNRHLLTAIAKDDIGKQNQQSVISQSTRELLIKKFAPIPTLSTESSSLTANPLVYSTQIKGPVSRSIDSINKIPSALNRVGSALNNISRRTPSSISSALDTISKLKKFGLPLSIFGGFFLFAFLFIYLAGVVGGSTGGESLVGGGGGQSTYTFVALGDSLTAWPCYPIDAGCVNSHPWGSYDFTGSPWPTHLAKIDTNLILKHNAGLPAKTSTYIESQFGTQVGSSHPDVLFVLAGTNDAGNGISSDVTKANLNKIIADAKTVSSIQKVILLTIPHQCSPGDYTSLNTIINGLASTYSPVIDISGASVLTCADFQQSDKLHLTDAGALKLAQYIDGQIKSRNLLPITSPGQGQTLTCSSGDYASCLLTYFKIVVTGDHAGDNLYKLLWDSFSYAGRSKQYVDLLTKGGQQIKMSLVYDGSGCHAETHGHAGTMTIWGVADCNTTSLPIFRHFIIHESGHVLEARNGTIFSKYPWTDYQSSSSDRSCYDTGYLKSYTLRCGSGCGINAKDESFAEAVSATTTKASLGPSKTNSFTNFSAECPLTYGFFETNVFGGYTYY